jgi:hypothetical protein
MNSLGCTASVPHVLVNRHRSFVLAQHVLLSAPLTMSSSDDPPDESPVDPQLHPPPDYREFTLDDTLVLASMCNPSSDGADMYALRRVRGTQWSATVWQLSR